VLFESLWKYKNSPEKINKKNTISWNLIVSFNKKKALCGSFLK
jgi:hypothetical protein